MCTQKYNHKVCADMTKEGLKQPLHFGLGARQWFDTATLAQLGIIGRAVAARLSQGVVPLELASSGSSGPAPLMRLQQSITRIRVVIPQSIRHGLAQVHFTSKHPGHPAARFCGVDCVVMKHRGHRLFVYACVCVCVYVYAYAYVCVYV